MRRFLAFNTLVAIGVIATVLYYLENSRWLPAMLKAVLGFEPSFDASLLLRIVLLLTIFTLLWSLNSHISALDARSRQQEDDRKKDDYDIRRKLSDLEGRINKNLNDSLIAVRGLIEPRLDKLESGLDQQPSAKFIAKPTWFESLGFRWEVLSNFASQWRLHPPDGPNESMLHATLDHMFQGPYCPRGCGLPVGDDLRNGRQACSRCGAPLRPGVEIKAEGPRDNHTSTASYDPLWPLRKAAYRDAVAALHEGKLIGQ